MTTTRRTRWLVTGLATTLAATLALAGCGAAERDLPIQDVVLSEGAADAGAPGAAPPGERDPGADGDSGGAAGGLLVDPAHIIFTGEIAVRVGDVDATATRVVDLADRYGGFVAGDRRASEGDETTATIVLRIPSERFATAVNAVGELGEEQWRNLDTEDVRTEVVDLQTRIATAQASVDRTRDLMEQARSISDIVQVEAELTQREASLASLQARQRELADLTAMSTITVTLFSPAASPPEVTSAEDADLGFLVGLRAGWRAFVSTMTVLLTVFGALLPWLAAATVPAVGVLWWARRRASRPVPAGSPPGN